MHKNYLKLLLWHCYQYIISIDITLLLAIIILATINIVVQYSANDRQLSIVYNDAVYLILGIVLMLLISNTNYNSICNSAIWLYVLVIVLNILVFLVGSKINGARRWLHFGISIQPSELCKLAVPLLVANMASTASSKIYILKSMFIIALPVTLIALQPDLSTAILVLCTGCFALFFAKISWKMIAFMLITVVLTIALISPYIWYSLHDYQQKRILTLIQPPNDLRGRGYHVNQGMIAIGSGGLLGKGYLQGSQVHLHFIPEKNTDFVATVIAEEFGYVGMTAILLIYCIITARGIRIIRLANNQFSHIIAGSISMSLMLYVLINLGMVSGILPVAGVPLPLLSYGGTATIVELCSIGVLMSIYKNTRHQYNDHILS